MVRVTVTVRKAGRSEVYAWVCLLIRRAVRTGIRAKLDATSDLRRVSGEQHPTPISVECALLSGIGFALGKIGALWVRSEADGDGYEVDVQHAAGVTDAGDQTGFPVAAAIGIERAADRDAVVASEALEGWVLESVAIQEIGPEVTDQRDGP